MYTYIQKHTIYVVQTCMFCVCKIRSWRKGHTQHISFSVPKDVQPIVIANHITPYDPLLLLKSLSWKTFHRLAPIKIMIRSKNMQKRRQKLSYIVGCYGSHRYTRNSDKNIALQKSITYLDRGYSVLLFPEGGSRTKNPGIGAWYLNTKAPKSSLQLLRIQPHTHLVSYIGKENFYGTHVQDLRDLYHTTMQKII